MGADYFDDPAHWRWKGDEGPFALCVCGSRDWTDASAIERRLDQMEHTLAVVIEGGAQGADRIAGRWAAQARYRGIGWVRFQADWERYGKAAGYRRNAAMVTYLLQAAELGWEPQCLAFDLGGKGTAMMVDLCRKAGVQGLVIRPTEPAARTGQAHHGA